MEMSHNADGLSSSLSAHLSQNLPHPRALAPCNGELLRQARQQQHPSRHAAGNSQHRPCCSGDFTQLKLLLQPSYCGPWLILKEVPYRSGHNEATNYYLLGRQSYSTTTLYFLQTTPFSEAAHGTVGTHSYWCKAGFQLCTAPWL